MAEDKSIRITVNKKFVAIVGAIVAGMLVSGVIGFMLGEQHVKSQIVSAFGEGLDEIDEDFGDEATDDEWADDDFDEEFDDDAAVHDESEVADHLNLESDGGDWTYTTEDGTKCDSLEILTTANEVEIYAEAGDVVAKNPDGSAGIRIGATEGKTCRDALTDALSDFP